MRRTGGRSISRDEEFKQLTRSCSQMELKMERPISEAEERRLRPQTQPRPRIRRHSVAEELLAAPWRLAVEPTAAAAASAYASPPIHTITPFEMHHMSISIQQMDLMEAEASPPSHPQVFSAFEETKMKRTSSSSQEITFAASDCNWMQTPAIYLLPLHHGPANKADDKKVQSRPSETSSSVTNEPFFEEPDDVSVRDRRHSQGHGGTNPETDVIADHTLLPETINDDTNINEVFI